MFIVTMEMRKTYHGNDICSTLYVRHYTVKAHQPISQQEYDPAASAYQYKHIERIGYCLRGEGGEKGFTIY